MTTEARQGTTYSAIIAEALERHEDRVAFALGDRRLTYRDCATTVSQYMQVLAERGVGPGVGVAALGPNAPELWLVQAASYLLGARFTGLNLMSAPEEQIRILNDADISLLLVDAGFAEIGAQVVVGANRDVTLLTTDEADHGENIAALSGEKTPVRLEPGPAELDDIAWLQYTGGTTGLPKGVMLSQGALAHEVLAWLASYSVPEYPRYLAAAPITHASVLPLVPTLVRGGTIHLLQKFDPQNYLQTIETEEINYAFAVPTMLYALLDHGHPERFNLSSLEAVLYGAAPMSPSRLEELIRVFGPVLVQGYSQTETVGILMSLRANEHDPVARPQLLSSCGRPAVGVSIALLDEHLQQVPDGEPGEICVRSQALMSGYWKQPELTEKAFAGGWLHTGDVGVRDADGFYYIVDRLKDMVISGGFNVYPREVEDVLTAHPAVGSAAVVGAPHDKWGEQVVAYVVTRPGHTVEESELINLVRQRKGVHYAPKSITVIDGLPTTPVGKIDKKVLRAWAKENSDA